MSEMGAWKRGPPAQLTSTSTLPQLCLRTRHTGSDFCALCHITLYRQRTTARALNLVGDFLQRRQRPGTKRDRRAGFGHPDGDGAANPA